MIRFLLVLALLITRPDFVASRRQFAHANTDTVRTHVLDLGDYSAKVVGKLGRTELASRRALPNSRLTLSNWPTCVTLEPSADGSDPKAPLAGPKSVAKVNAFKYKICNFLSYLTSDVKKQNAKADGCENTYETLSRLKVTVEEVLVHTINSIFSEIGHKILDHVHLVVDLNSNGIWKSLQDAFSLGYYSAPSFIDSKLALAESALQFYSEDAKTSLIVDFGHSTTRFMLKETTLDKKTGTFLTEIIEHKTVSFGAKNYIEKIFDNILKQARSRDLILTEKQLSEAVTISTETFRHFTHSQTKKILIGTSKGEEFLLNYSEIFTKSLFNDILSSVKEDMIRKHGVDAKTLQIIIVGAAIYSRDIKTSLNSQFSPGQIKMPNNPANFLVLGAVNLLKKQNKHTIKISGEFVSVELELKNSEGASVETLSESGPKDYPGALIVVSKSTNFSSIAAKFKLHNDSSTAIFKTLSCTQPSNYDPSLFTSLVFTVKLGLDFSGDEVEMLAVNHSSSGDKGPKNFVLSCQRELPHTAHMPSNDFSTAKASIDRYRDMELKQKQRQEVMERIVEKIESSWKLIEQFTALQISSVAKSSIETISGELNTLQNELFTFDKKTNHDAIENFATKLNDCVHDLDSNHTFFSTFPQHVQNLNGSINLHAKLVEKVKNNKYGAAEKIDLTQLENLILASTLNLTEIIHKFSNAKLLESTDLSEEKIRSLMLDLHFAGENVSKTYNAFEEERILNAVENKYATHTSQNTTEISNTSSSSPDSTQNEIPETQADL